MKKVKINGKEVSLIEDTSIGLETIITTAKKVNELLLTLCMEDTETPGEEKRPESSWEEELLNEFPLMGIAGKPEDNCVYRFDQYVNDKSKLESFISKVVSEAEKRGYNLALEEAKKFTIELTENDWITDNLIEKLRLLKK